ncbi:M28 family metallopeptidase [Lacibacter sp. H407]|uniref:M28 family metallopeptidase n=1 Tax=Lacibacter sp. H407 TaxID=3133423 RepID=UPI0030BD1AC8
MNKLSLVFVLLVASSAFSQTGMKVPVAGLAAIKQSDLKNDLYQHADARFKGRGAGTINELNAAVWVAEKYRSLGLKPAGENNSYYQYFNMWRNRIASVSRVSINGRSLSLWSEVAIAQMAAVALDQPIVYLGSISSVDLNNIDVKGKVVAFDAVPGILNYNMSLPGWRYQRFMMTKYGNALVAKGAAALILLADQETETAWPDAIENFKEGSFDLEGGPNEKVTATVPVLWLHKSAQKEIATNTARLKANIVIERYSYPSVNLVGLIEGTDPVLSKEYVLYSGHTDAHGIRNNIDGDSIYYGADDNASVNVAMFAVARAFKKNPGKRSVLFVIHGAEERGLLGSRWYSSHPTVPIQNIVAVLNGDMIGRNHPDSATVLGIQPPHRTSNELTQMVLDANNEGPKFKLDTLWDKVEHPEYWFFRSDHLPYARLGIPSLMYTTLLHVDYHTPKDNAANIDYAKLKKVTEWMYRTGWKAANTTQRPDRVPNFKLER